MSVKPIPEGYHTLTPSLIVRDAARAIEFYKQAFGAEVRGGVAKGPDGKVMHAELKIGDSVIMLADEFPEFGALSPQSSGGTGMSLHIYVEGVDAAFDRAGQRSVLGRPLRQAERSLRPQMVHRHSRKGHVRRRNEAQHGRSDAKDGKTTTAEDRINAGKAYVGTAASAVPRR